MGDVTLYIDATVLEKSWREEVHPRDKFGRFTTVKGGSKVVTKTGAKGTVDKVTATHYHITTEDGKKSRVIKNNALHEADHTKASKSRKRKAKAAGKKQAATKAKTKANGTKPTTLKDPTTKAKKATTKTPTKTPTQKTAAKAPTATKAPSKGKGQANTKATTTQAATAKKRTRKKDPLENFTSSGPAIEIKQNKSALAIQHTVRENAAQQAYKNAENEVASDTLSGMWQSPAVQRLLKQPEKKRDLTQIQKLAGDMTEKNDKLAHAIASRKASTLGISMAKNIIGTKAAANPIAQDTGMYGDMVQAARTAMYETLYATLAGKQKPNADIGAHVVTRMKTKLNRDLYGIMNAIPAPHAMRPALFEARKAEQQLSHTLGRAPSHDELAQHLAQNGTKFNSVPIPPAPQWDEKTNDWIAGRGQVKDPSERLALLKQYDAIQRTVSADKNIGNEGEREVTITGNAVDEGRSPEEGYIRKERQKELEGTLPKAMQSMGMTDEAIKVWTLTHSAPSSKRNVAQLTSSEVAEHINKQGGWKGKKISESWVRKHYATGRQVLEQALADKHPAITQLSMLKSFVFNNMLRNVYEYNLVKALMSWGLDESILLPKYVRAASGSSLFDIEKSLEPTEYIGSYVTVDSGYVHARIITHDIPRGEELVKAMKDFEDLEKALFPHKDGGNHEKNKQASDYVKKNKGKYKALADTQHSRLKSKSGKLTWSEQLQMEKGGVWISWGGKKILINAENGNILYDSANSTHRDEQAEKHGITDQEHGLEFEHEKDEAEEKRQALMKQAHEAHAKGDYGRSKQKWAEKHGVKWHKDSKDLHLDDEGNLQFDHSKHNLNEDHGATAFEESIGDLQKHIAEHKAPAVDAHHHKAVGMYSKLSDDEKEAYDKLTSEEREHFVGQKIGETEGVRELLERAHEIAASGKKGAAIHAELEGELKELAKNADSMGLANKKKMVTVFNNLGKHGSVDETLRHVGAQEISRAREEANKRLVPEGHYEIGNKANGKSMVVKLGHRIDPENGNYTTYVEEAFDPKTGKHFTTADSDNSWGQLAKELGLSNNSAESFIYNSNKAGHDTVMQAMDDDEAKDLRRHTSLGLQDEMMHKNFKMVSQNRGKDGNVRSTTYAQDMPDGTTNTIEVDGNGQVTDPIMARILQRREPIKNAEDLHDALKAAVGRKVWLTTHVGSDVHIGDALGHHVQVMYDGKGAPRVVGGAYDGYRFMDAADIPKGAVDPHTGQPIKALFKNGKLVDRGLSTTNKVKIAKGNTVMYNDGLTWRKGKVREITENGKYQITNSKGALIGMFERNELKEATAKGRTLSKSGQAVVKLAQDGVHRMDPSKAFDDSTQGQKAKELLTTAIKKAKITGALDREGNLKNLELNDKQHAALKKLIGRSKAGKAILGQFETAHTEGLELHVPEHLRSKIESEGVTVDKKGIARISASKFEQLRDVLGGFAVHHKAQEHLADHFKRKDRTYRGVHALKKDYQPAEAVGPHADAYRAQFKEGSFLANKEQGLYGTQLEGLAHLVERGNAIAGHGMGTGKTILGVMAALHDKASKQVKGQKAKKTLIVAPKGIMSDWGKEIGTHTNSKALYIGSGLKGDKHPETGRTMWGQAGTEQEAVNFNSFRNNAEQHASEDHDFHIVSYDTFMRNRAHFANSGMYDNMVIDEVHAFKNQGGKRGQSLAETTSKFQNVWGLSGTPMENDAREIHSLIDTMTGGKHELGTKQEFVEQYMMKDRRGKIIGVKPEKSEQLGDILANVVQFRGGEDVTYNDGSKIHFPHLTGASAPESENPSQDFVGNLVSGTRDHKTTEYYGTKHSVTDFESVPQKVNEGTDSEYSVDTLKPQYDANSPIGRMYSTYQALQEKYLPESKLAELNSAVRTGIDSAGSKGKSNYLTAMQKLQKFLNAPLAHRMYVPGVGNAIEADATDAQAEPSVTGKKAAAKGDPIPHEVDAFGHKRYYETDGKGGFLKNSDGSPKLLPPLHHNNPKADYLRQRVSQYLDHLASENIDRRRSGKPELMPKLVVKSSYTTFGTDIVDGVLRDLEREHPELQRWKSKVGKKFGAGRFTGDATDREDTKMGFRGNKKNYADEQGHLWATTVSPAGKEGVDFGNAHYMMHFDQDWNPQKMAQFTARVRRSDSAKSHAAVGRANAVRVESLHMPGTIEDFMFDAQDKKMDSIKKVERSTRSAETSNKYGETQGTIGRSHRGFTRRKKGTGAQPKTGVRTGTRKTNRQGAQEAAATTLNKGVKLVLVL